MPDTIGERGLDRLFHSLSTALAARSSRRSLLGKVSRPLFLVGQGAVQLFPVNRAHAQGEGGWQQGGCTGNAGTQYDERFCDMSGTPCFTCSSVIPRGPLQPPQADPLDWPATLAGPCPTLTEQGQQEGWHATILNCGSWIGCCSVGGFDESVSYCDCCWDGAWGIASGITCDNQGECMVGDEQQQSGVTYCENGVNGCTQDGLNYLCTTASVIQGLGC